MAGKSRFDIATLESIRADYEGGMRSGAVAAKYGIDKKSVTEIVRRLGGAVRAKTEDTGRNTNPLSESEVAQIRDMRDAGLSQQAIGAAIGRSQAFIGRALDRLGYARCVVKSMARHGSWKGGVVSNGDGYLLEMVCQSDPMSPMRNSMGYVLQHRLVMARYLGRPLFKHESVHHINGIREDNRIENLQLRINSHGAGIALECACCGSSNLVPVRLKEAA